MRSALCHFTRVIQDARIPAATKSDNLRNKLRGACNGFPPATKNFLRGLIADSDQTHAGDETRKRHLVHTADSLAKSPFLLPWMDLGVNQRSIVSQKKRSGQQRTEAPGMKRTYADMDSTSIANRIAALSISASQPKTRQPFNLREMHHYEIKRKLESGKEKQRTYRPRMSNPVEDLDKNVERNSKYSPAVNQYRLTRISSELDTNQDTVSSANSVHTPAVWGSMRKSNRKYVRQGRTDWGKYEKERSMWPPVCGKRQCEATFESVMVEPEHKIPKIAQYWVTKQIVTDGGNTMGHRLDETIALDWYQYELERNLWPRLCMKRKIKLEGLMEEPKPKVRRAGE